ncbi:MAG: L-seryl-tRNA(Sec) selenium transferase [Firmicutes bacterium HGW-Firmicutes-11]|nr:MAG: L-seryl-tRNA(Sec) selenium transferase [Firmicutes bacterium HGW-Firmicutes-11]
MDNKQELLKQLPKIDEVLKDQRLFVFFEDNPRELVVEAVREEIDSLRSRILSGELFADGSLFRDESMERIKNKIKDKSKNSLRRVINATGTIVHTNLGRANLSEAACHGIAEAAASYSTLEYDVERGKRGSRHDHVEKIIQKLTGAEAAIAVNNNAAAVLLCLTALATNKEVIVSRGELVEIGGSFRIPDIMEQGGAKLREVGTTNKTKIADYRKAITDGETGMLLKVHTSNYKIIGFTAEASLQELRELGNQYGIPVVHDLGSGLMIRLNEFGIDEPTVMSSLDAGADLVLFSGDKLLGGPQAGIAVGKKEYIDRMKHHPLARALRLDKLSLAALEATFREYIDPERAKMNIPVLSMITSSQEDMRGKAESLKSMILARTDRFFVSVEETEGQIGGGSTPNQFLPGISLSIKADGMSPDQIERRLRAADPPIISRINKDNVLLDMRTVYTAELPEIASALQDIAGFRGDAHA